MDTNYGNYGTRGGGYNRPQRDTGPKNDGSLNLESLMSSTSSLLRDLSRKENLANDFIVNVTEKRKRDVRDSKKFIELALIIDKAMVGTTIYDEWKKVKECIYFTHLC